MHFGAFGLGARDSIPGNGTARTTWPARMTLSAGGLFPWQRWNFPDVIPLEFIVEGVQRGWQEASASRDAWVPTGEGGSGIRNGRLQTNIMVFWSNRMVF